MISSFLICNISDEIGNLKAKIRNKAKSEGKIWKCEIFFVTSARPYSQANKESSEITARQCRALSRVFHKEK
jgi:hypothetical protein